MGQASCKQTHPYNSHDEAVRNTLRLSVIIPALNESASIVAALESVRSAVVAPVEVVVVDGGSTDDTVRLAQQHGAKVIRSDRGRGRQLNVGWRAARGDWCLFLHSDSQLPQRYDERIAASLHREHPHQRQQRHGHGRWAARLARAASAQVELQHPSLEPIGLAAARQPSGPISTRVATAAITTSTTTSTTTTTNFQASRRGCKCSHANCLSETCKTPKAAVSRPAVGDLSCGSCGAGGPSEVLRRVEPCWGSRGCNGWGASCCREAHWAGRTQAQGGGGGHGKGRDSATASSPPQPTWGAFATIQTDLRNPVLRSLLSGSVELRTRWLRKPYGDQALFVRRDVLEACGGFAEWPLLEDLELVERLGRQQQPVIVDASITTSGRRWQTVGFFRTTLINQAILAAYAVGVPPVTLARWYRDVKRTVGSG